MLLYQLAAVEQQQEELLTTIRSYAPIYFRLIVVYLLIFRWYSVQCSTNNEYLHIRLFDDDEAKNSTGKGQGALSHY